MRKALVVGIGSIKGNKLPGVYNDVNAVASTIETNGDGSPNFDIQLKTDILEKVTKSKLKGSIKKLFSGDEDTALFYFSGHGFLNELGGYIVTSDCEENDEGISMDEILCLANNSKIKNKIIILDCCHSGKFGSSELIKNGNSIINKGVTILTASKESESAIEINGQGLFTNLLVQALSGGASDLMGHITPGSVYSYIDQALGPWSQRPMFKTNVSEFVKLRKINPSITPEIIRKLINYFESPEDEFKLNPSYEDTNLNEVIHDVIEPFGEKENIKVFKDLQKMVNHGLVVPVETEHMYFAAMESKSCKLTALGYHYWRLVKNKKI